MHSCTHRQAMSSGLHSRIPIPPPSHALHPLPTHACRAGSGVPEGVSRGGGEDEGADWRARLRARGACRRGGHTVCRQAGQRLQVAAHCEAGAECKPPTAAAPLHLPCCRRRARTRMRQMSWQQRSRPRLRLRTRLSEAGGQHPHDRPRSLTRTLDGHTRQPAVPLYAPC